MTHNQTPEKATPQIQDPRKFFIIYKRDSAGDLARYVHQALHSRGVDTFLDQVDLDEGLTREQWRHQRDQALDGSDVFIFILTHSANTSDEIIHELGRAMEKTGSDIRVFIDTELWNVQEQLTITINNEELNITDYQCRRFNSQAWEELVRIIANSTLVPKIIKPT